MPQGPGTVASAITVGIVWFLNPLPDTVRIAVLGVLMGLGIWAAGSYVRLTRQPDPGEVVIDEVVGMIIAAWTVGQSAVGLLAAFVLFRFFDIVKPPPIRQIDRWSKGGAAKESGGPNALWSAGVGIILDDVVAGVIVAALMTALQIWT